MGNSPSKRFLDMSNVQNQHLLQPSQDKLCTVTSDFLAENYPVARKQHNSQPSRQFRLPAVDPATFKERLQKKIEEIRHLELSRMRESYDSSPDGSGALTKDMLR